MPLTESEVEARVNTLLDSLGKKDPKKRKRIYELDVYANTEHDYILWALDVFKPYFKNNADDPYYIKNSGIKINSRKTAGNRKPETGFFGNGNERDEETIQRRMIAQKSFTNRFGELLFVEYPIQNGGKGIDIVTRKDKEVYCIELKAPGSQESVLKAALEISYYLAKLMAEDHDARFNNATKVILVPDRGKAANEYRNHKKELDEFFQKTMNPLEVVTYSMKPNGGIFENDNKKKHKNEYDPRADFDYSFDLLSQQ